MYILWKMRTFKTHHRLFNGKKPPIVIDFEKLGDTTMRMGVTPR
jgi:hypothetical protein